MALNLSQRSAVQAWLQSSPPWPCCSECGSAGPFGVGKVVALEAGPTAAVVPVICQACGQARFFPADTEANGSVPPGENAREVQALAQVPLPFDAGPG
jgi:hypothetical protein